jgi:hypothetical protein
MIKAVHSLLFSATGTTGKVAVAIAAASAAQAEVPFFATM